MADGNVDTLYPDLKSTLQQCIGAGEAQLIDLRYRVFGGDLGMVSQLYKATLVWQPPSETLPTSLIIKLPKFGEKSECIKQMSKEMKRDDQSDDCFNHTHNTEVKWYNVFKEVHEVPAVPMPICYLAEELNSQTKKGIIVLQDLSRTGAVLVEDMSVSMTLPQLLSITSTLADLHAWALTTKFDWITAFADNRLALDCLNVIGIGFDWLMSQHPAKASHINRDAVLQYFRTNPSDDLRKKFAEYLPTVVLHGDFWTNNIFFKPDSKGKAGDEVAAIIDWQMVQPGTLFEDLCHVLTWCTSASIRRQHCKQLIQHYRQQLIEKLPSTIPIPEMDVLWSAYQQTFPIRALLLGGFLHIFLGTLVKTNAPDGPQRTAEMVDRAMACYDDAMTILNKK